MRSLKRTKKILVVFLTLVMIMGMHAMVFADVGISYKNVSVEGLESGHLTVEAYKIISYNKAGYYEPAVKGLPISISTDQDGIPVRAGDYDVLYPTEEDVAAIISGDYFSQLAKVNLSRKTPVADGTYTYSSETEMDAGTWLILVSGSEKYLYNPVIASICVTEDGIKAGELNLAAASWENGKGVRPKRSEPAVTKTAENLQKNQNQNAASVNGVQYGDYIKFTVSADIPDYSNDITSIQYVISDHLAGLSLVGGMDGEYRPAATVTDRNGKQMDEAAAVNIKNAVVNAIVDKKGSSSFEADLSDKGTDLLKYRGGKISIVYYAQVTSQALRSIDQLDNNVKLSYSTRGGRAEKSAETKHFIFGIDTYLPGQGSVSSGEFIKTDDKGNIAYQKNGINYNRAKGLQGAEFELYTGDPGKSGSSKYKIGEKDKFVTDENGRLQITGLDSDVVYYLKEVKAPDGYTLDSTPVKVEIDADYLSADGKPAECRGYVVKFTRLDGKQITQQTSYAYDTTKGEVTTQVDPDAGNPYQFKNTKLAELPSTGGVGTGIFTIGGCMIMAVAAGLFFAGRRKSGK